MLFNDGGLSRVPVDTTKQGEAAVLCSLLGTLLDPVRSAPRAGAARARASAPRLATAATALLEKNATIGGKEVAATLGVSPSRLARLFELETGMSLGLPRAPPHEATRVREKMRDRQK